MLPSGMKITSGYPKYWNKETIVETRLHRVWAEAILVPMAGEVASLQLENLKPVSIQ